MMKFYSSNNMWQVEEHQFSPNISKGFILVKKFFFGIFFWGIFWKISPIFRPPKKIAKRNPW
jgi:hypothetical protein